MTDIGTVVVISGVPPGAGGMGLQAANSISEWHRVAREVVAIGPSGARPETIPLGVRYIELPPVMAGFRGNRTWLRWLAGRRQYVHDRKFGPRAAAQLDRLRPALVHVFTQVGLEAIRWANAHGVPSILDSPNGHVRNYRDVYVRETRLAGGRVYLGHPTPRMVARVEEEYRTATFVRVSSDWARDSLVAGGVARDRVRVIAQTPVAAGIHPPARRDQGTGESGPDAGPLRVCFVGTLDLRKGFVHLLRAARRVGADRVSVRLVGGTVDGFTRRLLARERAGLSVEASWGSPLEALRWAELFVLPTLEDGYGFVVVEAMAAGLPVIVTDACGNAALVREGETGWVVPAGDDAALAAAIETARRRRDRLPAMGDAARADWERLSAMSNAGQLRALYADAVGRVAPGA
ncbi:MAG: glycosyltransferase family 4 protein [Gemmatimonadota bacterium]|nr:glycosyltransferase family 4 protein [Gemmatimonadota bacterium]MDE3215122.1 glycosyltransferase family 4 protein [Gemmatimonadota bacterium]